MKMKFISGLMALQLATAMTVSAQTYTFTIGNAQSSVLVADHIGGEYLGGLYNESTLESYNLIQNGKRAIGLMRFEGGTGIIDFAKHYWLPSSTDYVRALKGFQIGTKSAYVVSERLDANKVVQSAVLLCYNKDDGSLLSSIELPTLPPGFKFVRVFDVMEIFAESKPIRILCTIVKDGSNPMIAELVYNGASQYEVWAYKMDNPPKEYKAVHYVRAYHYGSVSLGRPTFYGLSDDGSSISAFCFYQDPNLGTQIFERYALTSPSGLKGISGVQMDGSYGSNGSHFRIEMAFTDLEGTICTQQKDELFTTNWERNWRYADKETFTLGWGRDGHGTKAGPGYNKSLGYFLGAWSPDGDPKNSLVTTLLFDGNTGTMAPSRVYDISGQGIYKDGSFPSTSYDPGQQDVGGVYVQNYTFIADRLEKKNTFRYGTGNTLDNGMPNFFCAKQHRVMEMQKRLVTIKEGVAVNVLDKYEIKNLPLENFPVEVSVVMNCPPEGSTGQKSGMNNLIESNNIELGMDNQEIRIRATEKAIESVRIFSIDGRSIAETQGVNAVNYQHQFAKPLVPGIYVIHIIYNDHSTEVRKVSIR